MDPCKEKEPKIINNALIQKCVNEQYPSGEAGRLAQEEGVPLNEIEYLRLEYLSGYLHDHRLHSDITFCDNYRYTTN